MAPPPNLPEIRLNRGSSRRQRLVTTSSAKPVLLRADFDAGHGVGSTRAQQDREAADTYALLAWQTNTKRHDRI
jgi:prolyl oligopeptidase